ncbi:MAG: metallophosphoesterase family protein [Sedimentisphaerales bacterium]|nr:metallophosphoesterase family protein [Sedimentisphaerales bacterium]
MQLIVLADIHSDLRFLPAIGEKLIAADVILIAGDITHFGGRTGARQVVEELRIYNREILAVPGNCDGVDVERFLIAEGISLQGRRVDMQDVTFGGVCHGLDCAKVVREDKSARDGYELAESLFRDARQAVLVTHQPAYGTKVDLTHGHHAGSRETRALIERLEPILAVSGHIHEAAGTDRLGKTVLVNPGPLCRGCYANVELSDDGVYVKLCRANK